MPNRDLIYAATSNGRVFTITWSNGAWSVAELASPHAAYISAIRVDPSNRIWVTMSQMGSGLVYLSDDSGVTWTDKTGALPQLPVNSTGGWRCSRADPMAGLWHINQANPGSNWSAGESLSGATIGDPAVTRTQDGRLVVFARRSDGTLWDIYQERPG